MEWYYNGIAGILPPEPGFRKVLIRPYLPESVNRMKCTYRSAAGDITVAMNRTDGKVELHVQTTDGVEAVLDESYI